MIERPVLTLAVSDHDRSRALVDGRVPIEGWTFNSVTRTPEEIFQAAFGQGGLDVTELSLSSYAMQRARGASPYVAVPAFVSRSFRHGAIYVRRDGVGRPADLIGGRVGVPEYQVTATVWVRAMLEAEYGVSPTAVEWVTGGVDAPGRVEKVPLELPPAIRLTAAPAGRTLSQMLIDGEISALICPRAPKAYGDGTGPIRRLFTDSQAASTAYYRKTGLFPIMHLIGVRTALAERFPELPRQVFQAFETARILAMSALADTTAPATMLPWQFEELDRSRAVMGDDFWPYGVARNREILEVFLEAHNRQGLSERRLRVEELFDPATLDT
jgi:4,5-dihydroxyphthalate decarboxylase